MDVNLPVARFIDNGWHSAYNSSNGGSQAGSFTFGATSPPHVPSPRDEPSWGLGDVYAGRSWTSHYPNASNLQSTSPKTQDISISAHQLLSRDNNTYDAPFQMASQISTAPRAAQWTPLGYVDETTMGPACLFCTEGSSCGRVPTFHFHSVGASSAKPRVAYRSLPACTQQPPETIQGSDSGFKPSLGVCDQERPLLSTSPALQSIQQHSGVEGGNAEISQSSPNTASGSLFALPLASSSPSSLRPDCDGVSGDAASIPTTLDYLAAIAAGATAVTKHLHDTRGKSMMLGDLNIPAQQRGAEDRVQDQVLEEDMG